MLRHRVIPALLLLEGGLVKTRRFADPRYVGDPINAIRIFSEKEVDELIVLDIGATWRGEEPKYDLIQEFAGECFMPLAYGGGVRTADQAKRLFALGVEKIAVQTAALEDLALVTKVANAYGSQAVVVSIDVKRDLLGRRRMFAAARRKTLAEDWRDFLRRAIDAGAGEILLTAVDRDDTMSGMDLALIRQAAAICPIPLTACGGVGSLEHIKEAVHAGASAVAAGAFFVYYGPHRAVLITYPRYQDLVSLLDEEA